MIDQPADTYDNAYSFDNVYGHALALLQRYRTEGSSGRIHLDIGCGYGRMAEPLVAALGYSYVGVDADANGLASLASRGFETHQLTLGDEDATVQALRALIGDRRLGSISMLDTLEHLPNGDPTLRAISRLAAEHDVFAVISVPNVAHADIGLRLAFGRWDYTKAGLLDHTHVRLFSDSMLDRVLRHNGLHPVDANNVSREFSDQHVLSEFHPALSPGTLLHGYLTQLRGCADANARVNQFVRICTAGPRLQGHSYLQAEAMQRPFLSIVTRTQGKRIHTLREVLTGLAGQTDTDFELLVIGHRLTVERQIQVEQALEDCPDWLRSRCRLVLVDHGNRTRPLNVGFTEAAGQYITVLDDDDLPMGHWVETFRSLAVSAPGRLLRAVALLQNVRAVEVGGETGLRAEGPPKKIYASRFDFLGHLRRNHTPSGSVAYPRGVFHDMGLHFDEQLTTTEDWDYLLRVSSIAGVASSEEPTFIYRWWIEGENSQSEHDQSEWERNYNRILQKLDDMPMLWPAGTIARIRNLLDGRSEAPAATESTASSADEVDRQTLRHEVMTILNSTSWRLSFPVRLIGRLAGHSRPDYRNIEQMTGEHLAELSSALRRSTSWRLTAPLRALRRRLG